MSFEVIPAVDVAGGRLARLTAEGPVPVDAFGGDPLAAAEAFAAAGARWIHVVDMDLALSGRPENLGVVRSVSALGVRVQASGGLASPAAVEAALEAGADRVVLGSAALADRVTTESLILRMGESLAVGIEVDGDRIRPRGEEAVELPLTETLEWLAGAGASRFVHTRVERVGGLAGPDLDGIATVVRATGRSVLASGGIGGVEDLRAVASLGPGVEGAIVGRALYEGKLDLATALAAVSG